MNTADASIDEAFRDSAKQFLADQAKRGRVVGVLKHHIAISVQLHLFPDGQIIGRRPIARFDCLIAVTAQIEGQAVAVEVVVVGDKNEVGLGFVTGVHGVLCGLI